MFDPLTTIALPPPSIDTGLVTRLVPAINGHIPIVSFQPLWTRGARYANAVAAVPSLHASFTLLISLYIVLRTRSRFRWLALLYPPAMAFALVYSGEHYLWDIIVGWLYTGVAWVVVTRLLHRRSRASGRTRPLDYGGPLVPAATEAPPPGQRPAR